MSVARKDIISLAFEEMSFAYEGHAPIFVNINLALPKSRAVWVRSPDGRGKSTLLRLLMGLLTPTHGRYMINGEPVNEMSFEEFLGFRLSMGYAFDMGGLLNNRTLAENLALPLLYHKLLTPEQTQERVQKVTDFFGMNHSADLRPFAISGSQRKLACLVRAFIHQPQVALLDDPVTGLKDDNLKSLVDYVEESFASRGLRQVIFTGENPVLANRFHAEELLISTDEFTTRSVA